MTHPLDGCWAKFQRAKENIDNLHREITDFLHSDPAPYKIVGRHQNNGLEYGFVAFGNPQVPLRFAVLAGEIIHHLRSSLDHLIYALVIQNGESPTNKNQFPICSTAKSFDDACKRGQLNGVSASARKLIASVQPYATPTPEDTVLAVVGRLDNFDKHRLLVIVTTAVKLGETITIGADAEIAATLGKEGGMPAIIGFEDPGPRKISKDGAELFVIRFAEPAPEFKANAELVTELAFEESGRLKFALIPTLVGLFKGTKHTVEMFSGEF